MRVLVIDDSRQVMETVVDYLELEAVECDCAYDGREAVRLAAEAHFDVIVADIAMPRLDGIAAVREIRERLALATPVIFLTAKDTLADKTAAFEAGGDDYLVKPFAMEELSLRIRALARRGARGTARMSEFGGLGYEPDSEAVSWNGKAIRLGRLQRRILAHLIERAPALVSRAALIEAVWENDPPGSDALRSHIYALRNALNQAGVDVMLETVHGEGYRLAL